MINGIQQVGIGVEDVDASWDWYRKHFGFDIPVFDDEAEAPLMTQYTGGKSELRRAILAMNLNGGGGMEIWQFRNRQPMHAEPLSLRQTGILATKVKCRNAAHARKQLEAKGITSCQLRKDPNGRECFTVIDPYGNAFIVGESKAWYRENHSLFGGIEGVVLGVKDLELSKRFYSDVLQLSDEVFNVSGKQDDLSDLPDGGQDFERVRLSPNARHTGAFSEVLGDFFIDLISVPEAHVSDHRYKDRFWGDPGFIHLCFDVNAMDGIKDRAQSLGRPFTIDSGESFSMGEAAGRFAYIEDPDGTLIELVETDKITVSKKLGWYLTLKEKQKCKPLPRWMVKLLSLNRVKD